jgi:ATP-dependent DNA helicase DinG
MPEPVGEGRVSYVDHLSTMMFELFVKTEGRALGLFTSYEMMNRVAELLEEPLKERGITLMVHGKSGTRDQITRIFREGSKCALLGTHSFWEGVDVSGDALSCVVVARLPFAAVGDPVVEARCEQIQLAGGNPFREFSLPQAVIRFRQGFGRLIRTVADRGVVVVADPRIITKRYGSSFVKSLPCPVMKIQDLQDMLVRVGAFFDEV